LNSVTINLISRSASRGLSGASSWIYETRHSIDLIFCNFVRHVRLDEKLNSVKVPLDLPAKQHSRSASNDAAAGKRKTEAVVTWH